MSPTLNTHTLSAHTKPFIVASAAAHKQQQFSTNTTFFFRRRLSRSQYAYGNTCTVRAQKNTTRTVSSLPSCGDSKLYLYYCICNAAKNEREVKEEYCD